MNYYSIDFLENVARNIILQHDPYFLKFEPQAVPIEQIVEGYGLSIDYRRLRYNKDLLGQMIFDDGAYPYYDEESDRYDTIAVTAGTMLIESSLLEHRQSYGRYRFTVAHELAHWILHKKIFTGAFSEAALYKSDSRMKNKVEWQANYLAAAILMPAGAVKRAFYRAKSEKADVTKRLAKLFEVSKEAMGIRIKELGLI
jgi:hypothetical protein